MFLPGMPDGAIRINPAVSQLSKEGRVTWFVGDDNYFSHPADDTAGHQLALATLMDNGHARPCQITATLGTPRSSLMRWRRQLDERGAGSFYQPRAVRGGTVITPEKSAECARLLESGKTIAQAARLAGISQSTLRKAITAGRIVRNTGSAPDSAAPAQASSNKSQRSRQDAAAAQGIGTACTRAEERTAAAIGLAEGAATRFEPATDIALGGVLCGLPALCSNGLFTGLERHLSLPKGYYTAMHILCVLGFMALARIRRPEQLRHHPPGELGKTIGLDRIPEVRTLREKIALLATTGSPEKWMRELSADWMKQDPTEAGYLYIDGHVRVYHGSDAVLPRRYVSRQKLCLRGTTDYWVNDALGRPFFVVSKAVTDGLAAALLEEIVPELLATVPGQPDEAQLAADPYLHRFVVVFDREGSHHSLLSQLWEKRIGAITYRKNVTDTWPESEFIDTQVPSPGGETTTMRLATRHTQITARKATPVPVLEVRRLTQSGHQTAIIATARNLQSPTIAGRMFSRWCQENYFGYMMQHYDIDGLIQYGSEEMDGTTSVINPAWRDLDKQITRLATRLRRHQANLGGFAPPDPDNPKAIEQRATLHETIQALQTQRDELKARRRTTPRKVTIAELPEDQRVRQLLPLAKTLTDTVKMIAYRAETALVGLLRPHLANEAEARALIRELFVSSADLTPDDAAGTLTISIHRMATPAHDRAIALLLADLTGANFHHPETGHRFIYQLV
jgi:transposase-like protein